MELIALFFSFALSLVCLCQDTRQGKDISGAIWLPVIWMMRAASRAFDYWLGGSEGNWADPTILSILTVVGLMVLAQRIQQLGQLLRANRAFVLFFILISMSVLWTDDVFWAFKRWVRLVGDVTMALIVLTEVNPFGSILCVLRRAVLLLIPLSLVLSLYFPALGIEKEGAWTGVTVDKNWLGLLCTSATALLLWNWLMRKRRPELAVDIRLAGISFEIPFMALSLYLLWGGAAGSRSSTAIVLLALILALFLLMDYVIKHRIKVGSLLSVMILAAVFFQVLPRLTGHRTLSDHIIEDVLHKDVNLTDRADFWPILLKKGMSHPCLGYGLDGFFTPQMEDGIQSELLASSGTYFKPTQAHNGYLQVFLEFGGIGLLLLALTLFGAFKDIYRLLAEDFEFGRFRLILLAATLLSNWTEATFARPNEFVWFLFLLVVISPLRQPDAVPAKKSLFESSGYSAPPAYSVSSFTKDAGQEHRIS